MTQALERTDRRYLWLRKRLTARADIWRVFPEPWHVQQQICLSFCAITKQQLGEILEAKASDISGNSCELRSLVWHICASACSRGPVAEQLAAQQEDDLQHAAHM